MHSLDLIYDYLGYSALARFVELKVKLSKTTPTDVYPQTFGYTFCISESITQEEMYHLKRFKRAVSNSSDYPYFDIPKVDYDQLVAFFAYPSLHKLENENILVKSYWGDFEVTPDNHIIIRQIHRHAVAEAAMQIKWDHKTDRFELTPGVNALDSPNPFFTKLSFMGGNYLPYTLPNLFARLTPGTVCQNFQEQSESLFQTLNVEIPEPKFQNPEMTFEKLTKLMHSLFASYQFKGSLVLEFNPNERHDNLATFSVIVYNLTKNKKVYKSINNYSILVKKIEHLKTLTKLKTQADLILIISLPTEVSMLKLATMTAEYNQFINSYDSNLSLA